MLTSHELLGFMSPSLAMDIITSTLESDKGLYRATLAAVADARKLRPVFLERQPKPQRHATMLASRSRPSLDVVAGNLIRGWLLKKHKELLIDYLNALGIKHEDGVVEDLPTYMDDEKLRAAVEVLLAKYPHETVAVYLHAFNRMNDQEWANLTAMLNADTRLQLGGAT